MLVKRGIDKFMKKPIQSKVYEKEFKKQRELKKRGIKERVRIMVAAQRMVVQNKVG